MTDPNLATYVTANNIKLGPGWGYADYFATVYTDISDGSNLAGLPAGNRDGAHYRADGALTVNGGSADNTGTGIPGSLDGTSVPISAILDGTSKTIAVIEDAGRIAPYAAVKAGLTQYQGTWGNYVDTNYDQSGGSSTVAFILPDDAASTKSGATLPIESITMPVSPNTANNSVGNNIATAVWRWADPDAGGSGISGPTKDGSAAYTTPYTGKVINQNNYPIGGPGGTDAAGNSLTWANNNIGLNDEPFSFHGGGCNSVFVDGSVHFLSETLDPVTLRYMVTRAEGKDYDTSLIQ